MSTVKCNTIENVAGTTTVAVDEIVTGAVGVGQTWQNMGGSRVIGVTYTNNTGKPIMVSIKFYNSVQYDTIYISVNGLVISQTRANSSASNIIMTLQAIVAHNDTYVANGNGSALVNSWEELR